MLIQYEIIFDNDRDESEGGVFICYFQISGFWHEFYIQNSKTFCPTPLNQPLDDIIFI